MDGTHAKTRLGILFAVVTAVLYAIQGPFFGEAARQLGAAAFIGVTQLALLLALPIILFRRKSRNDFMALLGDSGLYGKLVALLVLGIATIVCLQYGLKGANPIVVASILNLSPFWAALIAKFVSGKAIPVSPIIFFACFFAAFAGALLIAFSQMGDEAWRNIGSDLGRGSWLLALPLPFLTALNGTLVGEWFRDYDDSVTLAANFLLSVAVVVPLAGVLGLVAGDAGFHDATALAVALLVIGTVASSAVGRVTYQLALTATKNDNGFVSMFLLLVPALTALITLPLSCILPDLHFAANIEFLSGLGLVGIALLSFSFKTWNA